MQVNKQHLGATVVATALYIALNVVTIAVQFIPGLFTFLFWGFIGPLVVSIGAWFYLRTGVESQRVWILSSLAVTGLYAVLGYCSLYYIGGLWASI